jgi:RNA polymerase sigma-70 factor (ECF subfamily)
MDGVARLTVAPTALRTAAPLDFEALVREHAPRLLATARRLLRDESDARDALQEAFLQAYRGRDGFHGACRVSTWLHRIVVNACLMRLRSRRRRPEEPIETLLPQFLADGHHSRHPSPWAGEPEALLAARETRELVRACLDRLPDDYRSVIVLRDVEELSTEDAARALGISPGACKVRLHRARQALRGLLAPHLERGGGGERPGGEA